MKRIAVVTGSRADYGLLMPLLKLIKMNGDMALQLFVTGMHLSPEFGLTYRTIIEDGFEITDQIEMLLSCDTDSGITKSLGLGIVGFSDAFRRNRPDLLILLGDRFETFAAAQAAYFAKIPIAHLHGGELTEGVIDEGIRHAITKMSHFHFTATATYRNRVIQLGESPERVFNVGAIGIDNIKNLKLMTRNELQEDLDFKFLKRMVMVTYHPVTMEEQTAEAQFSELLAALDHFKDTTVIFTKANADMGGRIINQMMDRYAEENPERVRVYTSLGSKRYLSAVNLADAVIGNSSSGIIEVPSLNVPTINIGDRQKGRVKPTSVIDCSNCEADIVFAIEHSFGQDFRALCKSSLNPYGQGGTAQKILTELQRILSCDIDMKKVFFDLG